MQAERAGRQAKSPVESWEDHVEAWHALGREVDGAAWDRAAIAVSLKGRYGSGAVAKFADEVGFSRPAIYGFARTFEAFPEKSNRLDNLTFSHHWHAAVFTADSVGARAAVEMAAREGWSANALRAHLRGSALPAPAAESCATEGETCGPLTDRDRAFHIAGLVESLTESMRLFEAMKEYDIAPVVEKGTKKSLKELRTKIDGILGWLTTLKQTIDGRVK